MTQEYQAEQSKLFSARAEGGREQLQQVHFKVSFVEEKQKAVGFEGWQLLVLTSAAFVKLDYREGSCVL